MTTTREQMRVWRGPAILTYGFRPFFFGAAAWAALATTLWVPMLSGHLTLPTAFDPVSRHAHEFPFGYLGAVIAGFLLTAVPNWTGRLPILGWRPGYGAAQPCRSGLDRGLGRFCPGPWATAAAPRPRETDLTGMGWGE